VTLANLVGAILADAPAVYWRLNDPVGSTTVADYSTHGRVGTPSGVTFGVGGMVSPDTAAVAPTGGVVLTGQTPVTAVSGVSMLAAVEVGSAPLSGCVAWNGNWGIGFGNAGASGTWFTAGNQVIAFSTSPTAVGRWIPTGIYLSTGWHMLVLVLNAAGHFQVFVDGALAFTDSGAAQAAPVGDSFSVGMLTNPSQLFVGAPVGHAALFGTALSPDRIALYYASAYDAPRVQDWQRPWPAVYNESGHLLGVLQHTVSAVITDQLIDINAEGQVDNNSGQEVLDLTAPYPSSDALLLVNERRIRAGGSQFRVRTLAEGFDNSGQQLVTVHAEALWYDLGDYDSIRIDPPISTPTAAIAACVAGTPWSVGTVSVTVTAVDPQVLVTTPTTPLAILRSLPAIFGGELYFDNINLKVNLVPVRGNQAGDYLYARALNLPSSTRTLDSTEQITRLYPIGANSLDITSVNGGVGYIENYSWYDALGLPRVVRAASLTNASIADPSALLVWGREQLATLCVPKATYAITTAQLTTGVGSAGTVPGLGDVVRVRDDLVGYDISTRVSQRSVDCIEPVNSTLQVNTALYLLSRMLPQVPRQATILTSDLTLLPPPTSDNGLANGQMQASDSTGFPAYWTTSPVTGSAVVAGVASAALGGSRVLQIAAPTQADGGGASSGAVSVVSGEAWQVRADYLPSGPTPSMHPVTMRVAYAVDPAFSVPVTGMSASAVQPQILTPAGAVVVGSPPSSAAAGHVDVIAGWTGGASSGVSGMPYRFTGLVTIPPGAQFARTQLIAGPAAVTGIGPNYYNFDNVVMERVGVGGALVAGQVIGAQISTAISPPYVELGPESFPLGDLEFPGITWVGLHTSRYDVYTPGITYIEDPEIDGDINESRSLVFTAGVSSKDFVGGNVAGATLTLYSTDLGGGAGVVSLTGTSVDISATAVTGVGGDPTNLVATTGVVDISGSTVEIFGNGSSVTCQPNVLYLSANDSVGNNCDIVLAPTGLPAFYGDGKVGVLFAGTFGQKAVPFSGGVTSTTTVVTHTLGMTPSLILLTPATSSGRVIACAWVSATATTFSIVAHTTDGSTLTGSVAVDWLVM
jgi:phage minor structural protein